MTHEKINVYILYMDNIHIYNIYISTYIYIIYIYIYIYIYTSSKDPTPEA